MKKPKAQLGRLVFLLFIASISAIPMRPPEWVELYPGQLNRPQTLAVRQHLESLGFRINEHNGYLLVDAPLRHQALAFVIEENLSLEPMPTCLCGGHGRIYKLKLSPKERHHDIETTLESVSGITSVNLKIVELEYFKPRSGPDIVTIVYHQELSESTKSGIVHFLRMNGLEPQDTEYRYVADGESPQ